MVFIGIASPHLNSHTKKDSKGCKLVGSNPGIRNTLTNIYVDLLIDAVMKMNAKIRMGR